jgi:ATP-dependent Clp protease, protease subunit
LSNIVFNKIYLVKGEGTLKTKKFWQFKAKGNSTGELMLYGDIAGSTWWGDEVTPKDFKSDLDNLGDIQTLNIYINSDGGDVFAGQAIYSMLKRHSATKIVYIDGLAASIASLIAMAGDKIIMPANAMMMIHRAWTVAMGNANDFRKMAEDMDKIDESIVNVYESKTGMKQEDIITLLDAETWFTAKDALDNGFCDEIEDEKQVVASLSGDFLILNGVNMNLKKYKNAPKLAFISNKVDEAAHENVSDRDVHENKEALEDKAKNGIEQDKIKLLKAKLTLECEL